MNRNAMLQNLQSNNGIWDILIIGGGATGLGIAVDAAARGFKTLLLEQHDFAKGTSSRSTKLIHGGVRYLQQGDISLVMEALKERNLMIQNAPHLVLNQAFVIPNYSWWDGPFYHLGIKIYDFMSGNLGIASSKRISTQEVINYIPTIDQKALKGGIVYFDGQFDDARMAISLAKTAAQFNGVLLNYMRVEKIIKNRNSISEGVIASDLETKEKYQIQSKVIINATGVFADSVIKMDDPNADEMIQHSQGTHIVLDSSFLPNKYAIMVPHTKDGRVLFAIPWHNKVIVGTTETVIEKPLLEPHFQLHEVEFILKTAGKYLTKKPTKKDVLSVFSGLRPLVKPEGNKRSTKEISRHHKVMISTSGLITVIGGKWTTYRKMAEDTVDNAIQVGRLKASPCITGNLPIFGYDKNLNLKEDPLAMYGAEKQKLLNLEAKNPNYGDVISKCLPLRVSQVIWAVHHEMARTIEDMLARRVRGLFLDVNESLRIAPKVAQVMAKELHKSPNWIKNQLKEFRTTARHYQLVNYIT